MLSRLYEVKKRFLFLHGIAVYNDCFRRENFRKILQKLIFLLLNDHTLPYNHVMVKIMSGFTDLIDLSFKFQFLVELKEAPVGRRSCSNTRIFNCLRAFDLAWHHFDATPAIKPFKQPFVFALGTGPKCRVPCCGRQTLWTIKSIKYHGFIFWISDSVHV